jgi:CO/xanthine dehydrogenase Mo-binding subunit
MRCKSKPLPDVKLPELRQIGKPLRRVDALGKCVGTTVYSGDYFMPNMLHGKVFRSSKPHAKILNIDYSKARALPGVVCVFTADDMPTDVLVTDMPGQTGQKRRAGSDAPVLAKTIVRYVGEPIALVAAETLAIAEKALKLIEVDYEELPAVYDPLESLKPESPKVYGTDNIIANHKIRKGDVEQGFAAADLIVENTFKVPYVDVAPIEPESGVAWVDDKGVITIRVCTQVIEHFRSIALALGLPQNKVHIQGTMVGGGFGGKEDITVEIFLGLLAMRTNRPVRLEYTREESLIARCKRHPYIITHRTGVQRDGHITAAEVKIISNAGAYPYLSPYVLLYTTVGAVGPYKVDNVKVDSYSVATNGPNSSAFRGFGFPQAAFAAEQQMNIIAEKLGIDPLELRCMNYVKTGDTTVTGQEITTAAWLEETASRAMESLGEKTPPPAPHIKVGQGFSSYMQSYGRLTYLHDTSHAWVGLEQDGTVVIRAGVPDIGAGQASSLCQIASEVLGVSLENTTIYHTDSALTPLSGTSTATRQLYMSGNAVYQAAGNVRRSLLERASRYFEESPEELDMADSKVFVTKNPSQFIELAALVKICAAEGIKLSDLAMFKGPFTDPIDPETGQGNVFPDFTFGSMAAEVAVDTETGEVNLLKCTACHDVGRAINGATLTGQIQGGGVQGLGYALMEELVVDEGYVKTRNLSEYLIPTSCDFPTIHAIYLESGTGVGPFGAKGIGEPSLTPAAPAVANAIADAIGVHIHELPLTAEKVLKAVKSTHQ